MDESKEEPITPSIEEPSAQPAEESPVENTESQLVEENQPSQETLGLSRHLTGSMNLLNAESTVPSQAPSAPESKTQSKIDIAEEVKSEQNIEKEVAEILNDDEKGEEYQHDGEREKGQDEKFESVEQEYQKTLIELGDDPVLSKFKTEYEKLHRTLLKSRDNEKKVIQKCKDLSQELTATSSKVQNAVKIAQQDKATISQLQKEIEKAWKMVETSNEKEARSKDVIQQLKLEISNLQKMLEGGTGLSVDQENAVNELIQVIV
jgi:chromosome segregation ATPase